MARIRQIKPDFFRSEDVAGLEMSARLLFVGLWTLADREGRLLDRPRRIAVELFPYDRMDDKIDLLLGSLAARGLIVRYSRTGVACIQITGFGKHQKPHPKEPASELPPAPMECECIAEELGIAHLDTPNRGETRQATDEGAAENVSQPSSSVVLDPCSGSLGSGERPPRKETAGSSDPAQIRPSYRAAIGGATAAFLRVYDRYPNKDGKNAAANAFRVVAESFPGEETALSAAILAWFDTGVLKRHPYDGDPRFRPKLEKVISERRWEDDPIAPETPAPAASQYRKLAPIPKGVAPPPRPRP